MSERETRGRSGIVLQTELKSKVAVVTGSTSGIGLAVAESLAQAGCQVMLNGFGEEAAIQQLQSRLSEQYGVAVGYSPADVACPEAVAMMIRDTQEQFGGVDILVNNAGVQHVAAVEDFPAQQWDKIIAVNLSSAFHAIQQVLPGMKARGWGRIINVASIHGLVASPYKSAYVAAKHGVIGLTKTVALETAKAGVTCNAICPGYVLTPLVENQIADTARARGLTEQQVMEDVLLGSQPTKRFTSVEDIAAMAVFLCGPASTNITGSVQVLDGGYTAM
ncbi:3-hydroxybutyrate dehydrogenase [Aestuariicella hydrocarbonica]|uniref:3-hydroxybutyrate dehydrogenase n=1 Tax=Pseudomaricurvus hydrocarbonicus TaxID=1470433 RepID=A0A9E5JT20_9GAMM|nr:3-hydroxybutyrate dehydrogenase [Aestuariicella hydrocarbonica]NHO64345.1 3-hydroxybutyrate dehydrogenase [Aestuariicella hydrocarbonica]